MMQNPLRGKNAEGLKSPHLSGLSPEEERAIEKWRRGGLLKREDLFVAFLALGVILMILFIAMRVLSACPVPQSHGGRELGPGGSGRGLGWPRKNKNLNATGQQKAKIRSIFEDEHWQLMTLRGDSLLSPEGKETEFSEIHSETHPQITALLTTDQ